jgi:uncharacterized repeat protein (TIGR03803 family)
MLHSFNSSEGTQPYAGLIQGSDGGFYGTTGYGGASGKGTVFRITSSGGHTTLNNFTGSDGEVPVAGLVQGSDGNLYGTTVNGGASNYGTVFKITSTVAPTDKDQCKNGGWKTFFYPHTFKNQGDCIQRVNTGQ